MIITSKNKILAGFVILVVLFCSGHAFQTIFPMLPLLVLPLSAVVLLFASKKAHAARIDKVMAAALLFLIMVGCTASVYMGNGYYTYLLLICNILSAYGLVRLYSFRQLVNCHLKIMTVISCIALVGYTLLQTTTLLDGLPSMLNINGIEYRGIGIYNYLTHVPERNCGMFWEPGLFATHLTISMVFELLYQKKTNYWRIILFSVGIFTANSSAGFALWFLCMMLLLVRKSKKSRNLFKEVVSIIIMCIGIIVVLNFDSILMMTGLVENQYLMKLSSAGITESSRLKALEHNWESFLSSPIFGVGISAAVENMRHVADTSTSTFLLSVFGIMGGFYTLYWVYGIVKNVHVNTLTRILLLAIALVIINKEPHHLNLLSWCLMFFLIKGDLRKAEPENSGKRVRNSSVSL